MTKPTFDRLGAALDTTWGTSAKDITGQRFGRLVAIRPVGRNKQACIVWECKCDCGNTKAISGAELRRGHTRSCGCFEAESRSTRAITHGLSNKRIYITWRNMMLRCHNPSHKSHEGYGSRGIRVCDDWKVSVESFCAYVSQLPHYGEKDRTLDRINNNGNYEPGNVRWATATEQNRNKRTCKVIEFNGKSQNVSEWASELNMIDITLGARLRKGWSVERALTTPVRKGAAANGK